MSVRIAPRTGMLLLHAVLDSANSGELLDRVRPHALTPDFEVVWCGEG